MNHVLNGTYNPWLVLFSVILAIFSSFTALDLANRVTESIGRPRLAWLAGGAIAMGTGIWSMHFVGMLAFHLPQPITYRIPLLVLSIIIPVLASALALNLISHKNVTLPAFLVGGSLLGVAVAGMHYTGMAALHAAAQITYDGTRVIFSIILAFMASFIALTLALRYRHTHGLTALAGRLGGALAMGGGIVSMHYTAMAAARFTAAPDEHALHTNMLLATDTLGVIIILATFLLLGLTLVSGAVSRRRNAARAETQALREGEKRFRLLAETLPAIVWTSGPDGTTEFFNQRWYEYTGLALSDVREGSWLEIVHPDDTANIIHLWTEAQAHGRTFEAEYRLKRHDGMYCWHLGRATPQHDEQGRIVKWYGSATNIHDQKQAMLDLEKRAKQQAMLSRFGQQALKGLPLPQLLVELTAEVRTVMGADLCDIAKLLPEEQALVLEASAGLDASLIGQVKGGLEHETIGGYTLLHDTPVVVEDVSTETRFKQVPVLEEQGITSSLSVVIQGQRQPYGILAVHTRDRRSFTREDIYFAQAVANLVGEAVTRAQTVEALQLSERRYRSLIDTTTAVVWRATAMGEAAGPMASWCAFTGQAGQECQGWGWLEAVHPDDRELTTLKWNEAIHQKQAYEVEHRLRRHDGEYRLMSVRGAPVLDDTGAVLEWVGMHTDITEQKRAEEERRKFELEKIVANQVTNERRRIARDLHDGIRQQLVGIKMLSSNLYKKLVAKEAPEAQLVLEFSNLIGDANLEVRQLISGLVPAEIDKDSLPQAVRRAAANIEQWYGITCLVVSDEPIMLKDAYTANHLLHLASEAMTNAAKHARATQISVTLTRADHTLRLEIHDDGIGLPEQFEKIGGTGISSMRNRAELIGGAFSIESLTGNGTSVRCVLPDVMPPLPQAPDEPYTPLPPRLG